MEISIGVNHKPMLAHAEAHLSWLQAERQRLNTELAYVARQAQQSEAELVAFLQQVYGVDAQHAQWTIDTARGVIIVPDPEPQPEPAPVEEPAVQEEAPPTPIKQRTAR